MWPSDERKKNVVVMVDKMTVTNNALNHRAYYWKF